MDSAGQQQQPQAPVGQPQSPVGLGGSGQPASSPTGGDGQPQSLEDWAKAISSGVAGQPQAPVGQPQAPVGLGGSQPQAAGVPPQPTAPPPQPQPPTGPGGAPLPPQFTPQQQRQILSALQQYGYDTSTFTNDAEFVRVLNDALSELGEVEQLRALAQYGAEYLKSRGEEPKDQEPEKPKKEPVWNPPEYDPAWDHLLEYDAEQDQYVPKSPYVPPQIVNQRNAYLKYLRDFSERFRQNPYETIWQGIQDKIDEYLNERLAQQQQYESAAEEVQRFIEEHKQYLYRLGPDGQPMRHPVTGEEMLTPEGERLVYYANEARQYGITDPVAVKDYAQRMLERDIANELLAIRNAQQQGYPSQALAMQPPVGAVPGPQNAGGAPAQWGAPPAPAMGQPSSPSGPMAPNPAAWGQASAPPAFPAGYQPSHFYSPTRDGTITASQQPHSSAPTQSESPPSFLELAKQEMRRRGMITDNI